jgi:hypothetical protein
MTDEDSMMRPTSIRRLLDAAVSTAGAVLFALLLPGGGAPAAAGEIITLPDGTPARSAERDPSARALLESWLAGYGWPEGTHFDDRSYEILERQVRSQRGGIAYLRVRLLSREGDAPALAAAKCPGRTTPIEAQVFFEYSTDINAWVGMIERGTDGFDICTGEPLWTPEQVRLVMEPPPYPVPPKVSRAEVYTPQPGTPERKAIMDALRPSFEALFGPPIEFKVAELKVAAGFAWVSVHPQRPGGKEISAADWRKGGGPCEATEPHAQFWMHKQRGRWEIGWGTAQGVCNTDSIGYHGWLIGAPAQLAGEDDWGEPTGLMATYGDQYFDLWWLKK